MLTSQRFDDYAADDHAGAVGRLLERCDRQQAEIHQLARTIRQLRGELASERRHNTLLRARLALPRRRPRRRSPEQSSMPLQARDA